MASSVLVAFLGEDCLSEASSAAANTELRATGSKATAPARAPYLRPVGNINHPGDPDFYP